MAAISPTPIGLHPDAKSGHLRPGIKNGHHKGAPSHGPVGQHPKHHKKKHPSNDIYPFPVQTGDLAVSVGQLTFDAEGNDNPKSIYFSRRLQWPGGASGVTLGRGYDMGGRTEDDVKADLVAAGLDDKSAALFATGYGSGDDLDTPRKGAGSDDASAQGFVKNHREAFGTISTSVQKKLFENILPTYTKEAKTLYNKHLTKKAVSWEALKPALRDVLVDLTYQMWTGAGRHMTAAMNNDYQEMIDHIRADQKLSGYDKGRYRAAYLIRALTAEKNALQKPLPTPGHDENKPTH